MILKKNVYLTTSLPDIGKPAPVLEIMRCVIQICGVSLRTVPCQDRGWC